MATQAQDIPSTALGMDASSRRINGLDTIRFVCAFVVMLGHLELLPGGLHGTGRTGIEKMMVGVFNSLFNGPAAVIIFFLISGFCIHFPFRSGRRVDLGAFYTRRFFRIVPPAVVFFVLWRYVLHEPGGIMDIVLWSVFCEVVYYFLYPGLLFLRRRSSWFALIAASTAAMVALLWVQRSSLSNDNYNYTALGTATWVVGLPCWLLGCWLAENYQRLKAPSMLSIWAMRLGIYALSVLVALLHFHADSFLPASLHFMKSNCILLNLFVLPACVWLGFEIAYGLVNGDNRYLEWAGTWSYSLYLVHLLVPRISLALGFDFAQTRMHFLIFVAALAASYLFYLLIERPSHRLAVNLGRRMAPAR
jgi:peptidoglycan/LPS O-acetylase OafA/YrhL